MENVVFINEGFDSLFQAGSAVIATVDFHERNYHQLVVCENISKGDNS